MMGVILGTDTRHDFIQGMELCIHVGHLGCHNTNGAIMDRSSSCMEGSHVSIGALK